MYQRGTLLLFVACLLILLTPIAAIENLPLVDYLNHLARLVILTRPDDPFLAEHYQIDWSLLPNLGFDLIGVTLAQVFSVFTVGRIVMVLIVSLLLAAPMVLHYALYRRISALPLIGGPLIFSLSFQMAMLSYLLGLALAVMGFAVWLATERQSLILRLAILQMMLLVIFTCHLISAGLLAIFVGLSAASTGWRSADPGFANRAFGALRSAAPVMLTFILPGLLLVLSKTGGSETGLTFVSLEAKFFMMPASLAIDRDLAPTLLAVAALSPLAIARLGGASVMHESVRWPVVFLLIIYWPMPNGIFSSWMADWRLLLPAALLAVAAAESPIRTMRGQVLVGAVAIIINLAAAANAWSYWRDGDRLAAEARGVLAELPEGARLLPYVRDFNFDQAIRPPSTMHIAMLAVIEKSALVPIVFAGAGVQPISIRDPKFSEGSLGYWIGLGMASEPDHSWIQDRRNFVLAIRPKSDDGDGEPGIPLASDLVAESERFALFRLRAPEN